MRFIVQITDMNFWRYFYIAALVWVTVVSGVTLVLFWKNGDRDETCVFDVRFNRWECCVHVTHRPDGMLACVTSQNVRVLNNPIND